MGAYRSMLLVDRYKAKVVAESPCRGIRPVVINPTQEPVVWMKHATSDPDPGIGGMEVLPDTPEPVRKLENIELGEDFGCIATPANKFLEHSQT